MINVILLSPYVNVCGSQKLSNNIIAVLIKDATRAVSILLERKITIVLMIFWHSSNEQIHSDFLFEKVRVVGLVFDFLIFLARFWFCTKGLKICFFFKFKKFESIKPILNVSSMPLITVCVNIVIVITSFRIGARWPAP